MNAIIWIFQGLLAITFMFSGVNKAYFDEQTLVQKGQTGVEGFSAGFIKFIGIAEIIGTIGLLLPMWINKWSYLSPIAALCLGGIMIPAAIIHWKRKEFVNVLLNLYILVSCLVVAYFRWYIG